MPNQNIYDADTKRLEKQVLRIKSKHPDRCCVFVQKKKGSLAPNLTKWKFVVPYDIEYTQFLYIIRKYMRGLKSHEAIFTCINGAYIPTSSETFTQLWDLHAVKGSDGQPLYLYIVYSVENTFG